MNIIVTIAARRMQRIIWSALIIVGAAATASAQSFTVSISPEVRRQAGEVITYSIDATAHDGFTASIYLAASLPTLPLATVALTTPIMNHPYDRTGSLNITLTGTHTGRHPVVIEGRNGPVVSRDTAWLETSSNPEWRVYDSTSSGMPTNVVRSLTIDRNDVKWMISDSGLVRFDGAAWTTFRVRDFDSTGLSQYPEIMAYAIDSSDNVWVTTPGALFRYDGAAWSVIDGSAVAEAFGLSQFFARALEVAPNGDLLIAGDSRQLQLARRSAVTGAYTFDTLDVGHANVTIMKIAAAPDGSVWLLPGPFKFDGRFWTSYVGEIYNPVEITFEPTGAVWIISDDDLLRFVGADKTSYPATDAVKLPGKDMTTMAIGADGRYWLGYTEYEPNAGGGIRVSWGTSPVTSRRYTTTNSGLPQNDIKQIEIARDSTVWIVTRSRGIAVFDPRVSGSPSIVSHDIARRTVRIYPNPARDLVRIDVDGPSRVQIIDAIGQTIRTLDVEHSPATLSTSDLPPGSYVARVVGEGTFASSHLQIVR